MRKLLFVVWSLLLVAGNVIAEPREKKEVKAETKDVKETKESASLNCTEIDRPKK